MRPLLIAVDDRCREDAVVSGSAAAAALAAPAALPATPGPGRDWGFASLLSLFLRSLVGRVSALCLCGGDTGTGDASEGAPGPIIGGGLLM